MPFGGAEDASGQDMETDENQAGSTKEKPGKKTKTEDKTKQSSSEDYLKAVGAQVAAMLDPLGKVECRFVFLIPLFEKKHPQFT